MQNLDENLSKYLKDHEIYNLLFQGMEELARHQPENPAKFLKNVYAETPDADFNNVLTKRIILLGPPGCGKGTQCMYLVKKYDLEQLSTGNLLRDEIKSGSDLGKKAKSFMDSGSLVPDALVIDLLIKKVKSLPPTRGWIFDGFPRTDLQAYAVRANELLMPTHVIEMGTDTDAIIARIEGRRFDPVTGNTYHVVSNPPPADIASRCVVRDDDKPEICRHRFRIYNTSLNSIRAVFGSVLSIINVDGLQIDEVSKVLDQLIMAEPRVINIATREIIPRGPGIVDPAQEAMDLNLANAPNTRPKIIELD